MDNKKFIQALGFMPKNNTISVYEKVYKQHDYSIEIDFSRMQICYGDLICADCKTTQNFSQAENLVILECVNRLFEKGYKPQSILLKKVYPSGHGHSGILDILVKKD